MAIFSRISAFALAPLLGGACRAAGLGIVDEGLSAASQFLTERLCDQSLRVADALKDSAQQAWRTLEIALAGESIYSAVDRSDDKALSTCDLVLAQPGLVGADVSGKIAPK